MKGISIRVDGDKAVAAFQKAESVMLRHIDDATNFAANEIIAPEVKRRAPASLSQLAGSITVGKVGNLSYEVKAGAKHAAYVEGGTGPAAGRAKYFPNPDNLLMYLMNSPKARGFKDWSRSNLEDRNLKNYQDSDVVLGRLEQEMVLVRRAHAFAWWIYQHGTKAQPFMGPAVETKRSACEMYIRQSVDAGIREVFGAAA